MATIYDSMMVRMAGKRIPVSEAAKTFNMKPAEFVERMGDLVEKPDSSTDKAKPPAPPEKDKDDGKGQNGGNSRAEGVITGYMPKRVWDKDAGKKKTLYFFGFIQVGGRSYYFKSDDLVGGDGAHNTIRRVGNGALVSLAPNERENDDGQRQFFATEVKLLEEGKAWEQRDGQANSQGQPTRQSQQPKEHDRRGGEEIPFGKQERPIPVETDDPNKILVALKVVRDGGIPVGKYTWISGPCGCGQQFLVQQRIVYALSHREGARVMCRECAHQARQTSDGESQQRQTDWPVSKISPADEARTKAKKILAGGDTPASRLQAMVLLVQTKVAANQAEAETEIETILAEIDTEKAARQAEEEQRRAEEERRHAEEEAAAARVQAIEEAATILRRSRSQTNMAKALSILSQAGLELAVIAEVEARVAKMEEEERRQAEEATAAARQSRITELAEAAVVAAQAEGVEDPENAIAGAIAASEIEFSEKAEALTMAQQMWAESQQPEPAEEEADEGTEAELAGEYPRIEPGFIQRSDSEVGQNRVIDVGSLATRVLTAMGIQQVLTADHKAMVSYSPDQKLPVGKTERAIEYIAGQRGFGRDASDEEVVKLAEYILALKPKDVEQALGKKRSAQIKGLLTFIDLAKKLNIARAEADLAETEAEAESAEPAEQVEAGRGLKRKRQ